MPFPAARISSVIPTLALLVAAPSMIGCGAAAGATGPAAASPQEAVVAVTPIAPDVKASSPAPDLAEQTAEKEALPIGVLGGLHPGGIDLDEPVNGMIGGVSGGIVGGLGSSGGLGGLGLSGVGIGGGGTGIRLGGLGGLGTARYGILGASDLVSGTSINTDGRSVAEYGDLTTVGITAEDAARMLRGRLSTLRSCYTTSFGSTPRITLHVDVRLIVGVDAHTKYSSFLPAKLPSAEMTSCVRKAFEKVYVAYPATGQLGIIEVPLTFRPAK